MNREIKIITTSDGSDSLYVPDLNETYHSTHGAIAESRHVFINEGLDYLVSGGASHIKILEVGFGTGLNAILTLQYCQNHPEVSVDYTTLEPYPLPENIISELNYAKLIEEGNHEPDFMELHNSSWSESQKLTTNFTFSKHRCGLQEFETEREFDLVFYDAFAPSKQSEMWSFETLEHCVKMVEHRGVLVTYCASGQFKRDLTAMNMKVETLQGPPGKKEMVRATK